MWDADSMTPPDRETGWFAQSHRTNMKLRTRVPYKTFGAVAIVSITWFLVIIFYLNDLIPDQKGDTSKKSSGSRSLQGQDKRSRSRLVSTETVFARSDDTNSTLKPNAAMVAHLFHGMSTSPKGQGRDERWESKPAKREPQDDGGFYIDADYRVKLSRRSRWSGKGHRDPHRIVMEQKPKHAIPKKTRQNAANVNLTKSHSRKASQSHNTKAGKRDSQVAPPDVLAASRSMRVNSSSARGSRARAGGGRPGVVGDAERDREAGQVRHSFNVSASDVIPLTRSVPDARPPGCPRVYPTEKFPAVSVIICFHNEAWSTLLRTVHSVLLRSPPELLHEVILVDDASTHDYLGIELERYLLRLPEVQLVRSAHRLGLIRARMHGVAYARGQVLVFLDSHCECGYDWLQPLLAALHADSAKVVSPVVDIIQYTDFEYVPAHTTLHGSFDWNLNFVWKELPRHERQRRHGDTDPIRTPTMIGGLFAVTRAYFLQLGQYDDGLDIWGGENIELSFRVWMCGGSLEIIPCSRVGHVFRLVIPYGFPRGGRQTLERNAARVAETWLDQYKPYFYASRNLTQSPEIVAAVAGRRALRRQLGCQNFTWYLSHVLPELTLPTSHAQHFGLVQNAWSRECLTCKSGSQGAVSLTMETCRAQSPSQVFQLSASGELTHRGLCVTEHSFSLFLLLPCHMSTLHCHLTQTAQLACTNTVGQMLCVSVHTDSRRAVLVTCHDTPPGGSTHSPGGSTHSPGRSMHSPGRSTGHLSVSGANHNSTVAQRPSANMTAHPMVTPVISHHTPPPTRGSRENSQSPAGLTLPRKLPHEERPARLNAPVNAQLSHGRKRRSGTTPSYFYSQHEYVDTKAGETSNKKLPPIGEKVDGSDDASNQLTVHRLKAADHEGREHAAVKNGQQQQWKFSHTFDEDKLHMEYL